jgi:hypothetical protein
MNDSLNGIAKAIDCLESYVRDAFTTKQLAQPYEVANAISILRCEQKRHPSATSRIVVRGLQWARSYVEARRGITKPIDQAIAAMQEFMGAPGFKAASVSASAEGSATREDAGAGASAHSSDASETADAMFATMRESREEVESWPDWQKAALGVTNIPAREERGKQEEKRIKSSRSVIMPANKSKTGLKQVSITPVDAPAKQPVDVVERLKRAVMLIETGWMDDYPLPCEVAGRDEIKAVIAAMEDAPCEIPDNTHAVILKIAQMGDGSPKWGKQWARIGKAAVGLARNALGDYGSAAKGGQDGNT